MQVARDLHDRGADDDGAGAHDLLQVDLQPDHEQHQDQAELGNDVDRFFRLHQVQPGRAEQEAAGEIGEDGRLAEKLRADAENPGGDDGKSDVLDQFVHVPAPKALPRARAIVSGPQAIEQGPVSMGEKPRFFANLGASARSFWLRRGIFAAISRAISHADLGLRPRQWVKKPSGAPTGGSRVRGGSTGE